jgi:hypothetical protein
MHAFLLHIYNHSFTLFILIVVYPRKSVMSMCEQYFFKQRPIFCHAYVMHSAMSWFHVLNLSNDI